MSIGDPDHSIPEPELAAIEFKSPGRFSIAIPPTALPQQGAPELAPPDSVSTGMQSFQTASEARRHVMTLLCMARRSVRLYSPDFEPWLYNYIGIQQACMRFVVANSRNRFHVLLKDSSRAVKQGHQLVSLSRRLSSNMHIRKVHPEYTARPDVFLVVDDQSVLIRPKTDELKGYVLYSDPSRARQLQRQFDTAWQHSLSDPDLRSFLL